MGGSFKLTLEEGGGCSNNPSRQHAERKVNSSTANGCRRATSVNRRSRRWVKQVLRCTTADKKINCWGVVRLMIVCILVDVVVISVRGD